MINLYMRKGAGISVCGLYRYWLSRTWDEASDPVVFIMLNPSTANADLDDPTIRRCMNFAQTWNHGGVDVVNLFAYRATDPKELRVAVDPVGPENDRNILDRTRGRRVIAAWGTSGTLKGRNKTVMKLLADAGVRLESLRVTKDWHPQHPLYVRGETVPVSFGI